MAYNSTVTGSWTFEPPLSHAETRALPGDFEWIKFDIENTERETGEGVVVTRRTTGVSPAREGEWNYYTLVDELTRVAELIPSSHMIRGAFIRVGEEAGDVERYREFWSEVFVDRAELRWPDGKTVEV